LNFYVGNFKLNVNFFKKIRVVKNNPRKEAKPLHIGKQHK